MLLMLTLRLPEALFYYKKELIYDFQPKNGMYGQG